MTAVASISVESFDHVGLLVEVPKGVHPRTAGGTKKYQLFTRDAQTRLTQSDKRGWINDQLVSNPVFTAKAASYGITDIAPIAWDDFLKIKSDNTPSVELPIRERHNSGIINDIPVYAPDKPQFSAEERMQYFADFVNMIIHGDINALLATGNKGLGKTTTVERKFEAAGLKNALTTPDDEGNVTGFAGDYRILGGKTSALELYRLLYAFRERILVIDDCNSAFSSDCVELLKNLLDTGKQRFVSWNTKSLEGTDTPKSFEFTGRIIMISNLSQQEIRDKLGERAICANVWMTESELFEYIQKHVLPDLTSRYGEDVVQDSWNLLQQYRGKIPNLNIRTLCNIIIRNRLMGDAGWKNRTLYALMG